MHSLDLGRMGAVLLLAIVLLVPLSRPAEAAASPPPDQYIVVLERGADVDRVAAQHDERFGAAVKRVHERLLNGYTARIAPPELAAVRDDPRVTYVERDRVVRASGTQLNPPWGLDRTDQTSQPLDARYTYGSTGTGVTAYIIDTGIRATHQDFGGRVATGFSAIADGRGSADCNGHGTHVAGTVGGSAHGIAKTVGLVPVRVLDCEGEGTISGVIAGVEWVSAQLPRPAVANMSLGGGPSQALDTAVRTSIAKGIVYALAAGNDGADACQGSPGRVAEGLTIAATTRTDARAAWSNYGSCLDWFAPGAGIRSDHHTSDTAVATLSGTSMAAPHTAGAAALILERRPTASPAEVREGLATWLTQGIVTEAKSAENDLLHVPPEALLAPPDNAPPEAAFTGSCAQLSCQLDARSSTDSDGTVVAYDWSFGDGAKASGPMPSHAFAQAGTYTITLTAKDDAGATDTGAAQLTVAGTGPAPADPEAAAPETGSPAAPFATLRPSGFRVLSGSLDGRGGAPRLARDDSARLELRGSDRGTRFRSELETIALLDRAAPAPTRLSLLVDLRVSRTATVTLRLYDFERRRFETLLARRVVSGPDQRLTWSGNRGPSAYVGPSGRVRLAIGAATAGPHRSGIDQVRFELAS